MQITLTPEIERVLIERAQRVGATPDQLAIALLCRQLTQWQSTSFTHEETLTNFLDGYAGAIRSGNHSASSHQTRSPVSANELLEIGRRCAALPVLDHRSADEILGYNQNGLLD
ncbi:MAG: hypothetical protein WAV07_13400 [Candidatus Contendobacter sp.]